MVYIAVSTPQKEEAERCLREVFPEGRDLYKICDPWESSYQPESDWPDEEHGPIQQTQAELSPSTNIISTRRNMRFLFSGAVQDGEHGLTVAHSTEPEDRIKFYLDHDSLALNGTVGQCLQTYGNLLRLSGETLTADLAFLRLNTRRYSVHNTVRWPLPIGKPLQIRIFKEHDVPEDNKVMILDQNGDFQYGYLDRNRFTDRNKELHNLLAISNKDGDKDVAITAKGDSGALVMSRPNNVDFVYVFGVASFRYDDDTNGTSLTLASSLWDVIRELHTNHNYRASLINMYDDIDFA